jgi:hypothetical protein
MYYKAIGEQVRVYPGVTVLEIDMFVGLGLSRRENQAFYIKDLF